MDRPAAMSQQALLMPNQHPLPVLPALLLSGAAADWRLRGHSPGRQAQARPLAADNRRVLASLVRSGRKLCRCDAGGGQCVCCTFSIVGMLL